MRARHLLLQLDDDPRQSPSRRLVQAIQRAIQTGRLAPGQALPGSRALADMLSLNRNTVVAALHELEAEGWLASEPNRGTFVVDPPPDSCKGASRKAPWSPPAPNFDLPSRLSPLSATDPQALDLSEGLPDPDIFPASELARAYQRALQRHSGDLLQNREPLGNQLLRETLAGWLRERRALDVTADHLLITPGSRQALSLLGLGLFRNPSMVAVEDPGNPRAWEALRRSGPVELRGVPVDQDGLVPAALEALAQENPLRAVYLTPQRQFPTTVVLSPERRRRLLEWADTHRIALIEDDTDAEYAYGESSPPPLAAQDLRGQVIHIGSLSRLIAPGIRLGYMVAPPALVQRLARLSSTLGWQGDRVLEWAVADLMRDGLLAAHLRKARKIYRARLNHFVDGLARGFGDHLHFQITSGGLACWVRPRPGVDLAAWVAAARGAGLVLHTPSYYALAGPGEGIRLGFARMGETSQDEALRRLDRARGSLR